MGIKSQFNKFLKSKCPYVFQHVGISHYKFKKVAIDLTLYLNKSKAIDCNNCSNCSKSLPCKYWLKIFLNMICVFRENNVHCVFIFDGEAPPEKLSEQQQRRDSKQKNIERVSLIEESISNYENTHNKNECFIEFEKKCKDTPRMLSTSNYVDDTDVSLMRDKLRSLKKQTYSVGLCDFELVKEMLDILSVPYFTAPSEAETMCADLNKRGLVDAAMSEDTDVMAYGAPVFLSKYSAGTCVQLNYDILLESLGLTYNEFLDLCILCGTDYNKNVYGIGANKAYEYILKYKSIENIIENVENDFSILKHSTSRRLFKEYEKYDISNIPYCGKPDLTKLKLFINKNCTEISYANMCNKLLHSNISLID
jgi:5'-3' exonuclease